MNLSIKPVSALRDYNKLLKNVDEVFGDLDK